MTSLRAAGITGTGAFPGIFLAARFKHYCLIGILADNLIHVRIGHGDILGSVEEGKKADLILVNIEQPHITPTQNLVNTIVDAANGHDVMDSIINGKLVMKNREVLTLDEERIRFEATQHMNEIIKRAY